MGFVPVKGLTQQDIQSLHHARECLMKVRTALINEIRGLLSEYGIVLPGSVSKFRTAFIAKLEVDICYIVPKDILPSISHAVQS
jgi:transposase